MGAYPKKFRAATVLTAIMLTGSALGIVGTAQAAKHKAPQPPIKIGEIVPINTATGTQVQPYTGVKAAVRGINAAGGVDHRKLQLVFCNEGGDPNAATACANLMVADKVVATVYDSSTTAGLQVSQILKAARIPEIYPNVEFSGQYSLPNVFPLDGGHPFAFGGMIQLAHSLYNVKSLDIVRLNVPAVALYSTVIENAAKNVGVKVVNTINIPVSVTDYSSYAQQIAQDKPDAVITVIIESQCTPLIEAIAQAGDTNIRYLSDPATCGAPELAQLGPLANGMMAVSTLPPIADTALPGIRLFLKDMQREANSGDTNAATSQIGQNTLIGWMAVQGFAKAAASVKGSLTSLSLLTYLHKAKNLNVQGLATWSPGAIGPLQGYRSVTNFGLWPQVVQNGKYTTVGSKPISTLQAMMGLAP